MAKLPGRSARDRADVSTSGHSELLRHAAKCRQAIADLLYSPSDTWLDQKRAQAVANLKQRLDFAIAKAQKQIEATKHYGHNDRGAVAFLNEVQRLRTNLDIPQLDRASVGASIRSFRLECAMLSLSSAANGAWKYKDAGFVDVVMTVSVATDLVLTGFYNGDFETLPGFEVTTLGGGLPPRPKHRNDESDLIDFTGIAVESPSWLVERKTRELWIDARSTPVQIGTLLRDLKTMATLHIAGSSAASHDILLLARELGDVDRELIRAEGFYAVPLEELGATAPLESSSPGAGGSRKNQCQKNGTPDSR